MVTKAPPLPPALWWYDGYAEIGGRIYLNDPDKTKLGKFYKYRDDSPGVFGNFYFGAHRTGADPLDITAWGKNIGWDDQAFELNLSKPGSYYLTFGWDETPHVYAKDAKTTFGPLGGNVLSTPCYPTGAGNTCGGGTTATANTNAFVNGSSQIFDLGFRRDTASVKGRWTPDDNWDVTASYSHMHRDGTQALSGMTNVRPPNTAANSGGTNLPIQLPKPVDDTTQNANLKAEYAGSSPWGQPFNVAFGYGVSVYNDQVGCGSVAGFRPPGSSDANCLTFQNPWIAPADNSFGSPAWNRYSLPPDNQAHTFTATSGVGLPFKSRYMGTFQYTWMAQDETFLTSTINPAVTPAALSGSSLDADARTILSNNVLHTQITSNLDSNLRYRYYDYHSNQSPITVAGAFDIPDTTCTRTGCGTPVTEIAHPISFNKQNANAQLVYRPWKWLDVGAAYEWERWRHEYADSVDVVTGLTGDYDLITNENAGKVYFDAKWGWSTLRTSVRFGERRVDGDYIRIANNNNAFRTVDAQNRDSTIVKSSWAINVTNTVTVTPNGGYQLDDYDANGINNFGISRNESWNAGADVSLAISPMAAFYVSYLHENGNADTYQNTVPSNILFHTQDFNDTFILGGKFTVIPEKLFANATYTYSKGTSKWSNDCGPGGCLFTPMPVFPDIHNKNQRVDAWVKYVFDDTFVKAAGWKGKAFVKARVVWEKNDSDSWQNIDQQLGWAVNPNDTTVSRMVFLGISDPNYSVVVGMLSFGVKW